jgi:tetratricopeptide (TPR) repeat protein
MIRFHQKEYYNSILLFSQMLEKEPENYAASYYRGISYIEQKSYSQAIRDFNHIIKGSNNLYIENAEWFLCLCLIENNQIEEARTQLEKIAYNPENSHQENAIEILHKINS